MFVDVCIAEFLGANCYAVAAENSATCVLFDAGWDASTDVAQLVAEAGLKPEAIVLTHGHPDHIAGIHRFHEAFGDIPTYLHKDDMYRLDDPAATLPPEMRPWLAPVVKDWVKPNVVPVSGNDVLEHAGLSIAVLHTPGHTEGSCVFLVRTPEGERALFTGDVLFAGSIGRVDLSGGNPAAMQQSLRLIKQAYDQPVYPGHGPATRLNHEIMTNPYL